MAQAKDGDDPAVVTRTIVTATTDKKQKPRYIAGLLASRVTTARRLPAGTFDKQICKNTAASHLASRSGLKGVVTPERIAALAPASRPNGLAVDPDGRTLYVADSLKGIIWSIPVAGGSVTPWLTDAALAPVPTEALPIGANGLRFHNSALWVSNFNKGTLLPVPVTTTGVHGPIRQVSGGLPNIDDLSFLTPRSDVVFAAQNGSSSDNGPDGVVAIYPTAPTSLS
ncbi:SMP-30/gluconolactonase/LRE family protein [Streptomyces sp. STR69]|uniref:SMP-30/gluconolactonase/LRE family protein n=1 Tax=Streptomyces sp. STR69 TaxID=1796942 RepID=UPI0021C9B9C1|nr:SMP-30/gluconolactonase/LRE family protein [Streptomyces sp. STR69]